MKHVFKLLLITYLLAAYFQVNANVTYCDTSAAAEDSSKKVEDGKKVKGSKKAGAEEEEEPDCD